jgi:hypothetical protein
MIGGSSCKCSVSRTRGNPDPVLRQAFYRMQPIGPEQLPWRARERAGLRQSKRSQINADEFVSAAGEKRSHPHVAGMPERWPPDDNRHQRFRPDHCGRDDQAGDPYEEIPAVRHCRSAVAVVDGHFMLWFLPSTGLKRRASAVEILQLCHGEVFCNGGRRKKAGYRHPGDGDGERVADIRKAANRAALPISVYVRMKVLEAARAG